MSGKGETERKGGCLKQKERKQDDYEREREREREREKRENWVNTISASRARRGKERACGIVQFLAAAERGRCAINRCACCPGEGDAFLHHQTR